MGNSIHLTKKGSMSQVDDKIKKKTLKHFSNLALAKVFRRRIKDNILK